jgi:nucleoside-diphosphate-sugar epimerase
MWNGLAIESEEQLEDLLSEPTAEVVETLGRLEGDIVVLGVGGKMGPTLARMAKRASDAAGVRRRVIGVSRFSGVAPAALEAHGITTIQCDLLDEDGVRHLPEAPNIVYMVGRKFGSTGDESTTWVHNSYLPGVVSRRYPSSRIVVLSTGNVYGLVPVEGRGACETDRPNPIGEYAMSCLGRERVFEHFSGQFGIPMVLVRLNYACELRYGVLVDLARSVSAGSTIDLSMGSFNIIWQSDANAMILRAFDRVATPPWVVNVAGPERLLVRAVCECFGKQMGQPVRFAGTESDTALLSDCRRGQELLGPSRVSADQLMSWVADWVAKGGRNLGKPTHFESRDGRFYSIREVRAGNPPHLRGA